MIVQREEIKQEQQEIAESTHAEAVYRDIVAREKERQKHEKRWFWELLQNAKDSVDENQKIKVILEITDDQVSFSHTGNPFKLKEILILIMQGSSKTREEGKTGRFGTGFITTYLLSREVTITGKLENNKGYFRFLLNRNADDSKRFYELQQESNEQFIDSISDKSYLTDNKFQTNFTYRLDDRGKETAKTGLKCLNELIPIALLFNEQIDTVTVIENGKTKIFSNSLIREYAEKSISEWHLDTIDSNVPDIKAYLYKNERFMTCILTQVNDKKETILRLTNDYPRLFFAFPLIGTEGIGIPLIINSKNFDPRVERDGIYSNVQENEKKENDIEIIRNALLNGLESFAELFITNKIDGIFELFNFNCDREFDWIDNAKFTSIKEEAIDLLASREIIEYNKSGNNRVCLNEMDIPLAHKEENINDLWNIFSDIKSMKIPLSNDLPNWINIAKNISFIKKKEKIYDLLFVWSIEDLISGFVEKNSLLAELEKSITNDVYDWLNRFYCLIIREKENFPLDRNIALNQRNVFIKAEDAKWDKCNDEDLNSISDLAELNFADRLFSREIIPLPISIASLDKNEAINNLLSRINSFSEDDLVNPSSQECNAKFLKWLILNVKKEKIKDLKIITGENKYEHLSEHLLLAPKAYFMNDFPLYADLIREKNCLSDIYNNFLVENDYVFLYKNDFIHLKPLIVKKEEATIELLKDLIVDKEELSLLIGDDRQLRHRFEIEYSDFAYFTTNPGHIYDRNPSPKSSLELLKFFLIEAVENDKLFDKDEIKKSIEGIKKPIKLNQCRWVYRAKRLKWMYIKNEDPEKSETETPSLENLSKLLTGKEELMNEIRRGEKQQRFLTKLGIGISDLIRNTLPSEEKENYDKVFTRILTSNENPKLVMAILNDPNAKKMYEKRVRDKELINRNQAIGKLIEELFKEYIKQIGESGISVCIERKPFGSDYILTEESSDLVNDDDECEMFKINDWLVELKATGKEYAAMTQLQAKTAKENKETYALIVVPLGGTEPDIDYLKRNARVVTDIGSKIDIVYNDFDEVEMRKNNLSNGRDGISVDIEDHNIRFRISSDVWDEKQGIEEFIAENFQPHRKT